MSGSVTLANGDQVKVNDHVYHHPVWAAREGAPYSIARVMAFLPAATPNPSAAGLNGSTSSKGKSKSKDHSSAYARVRLAWYYRPTDVSDKQVADVRLVLPAIYSEVTDLGQLRGKCYVAHRERITDLAGWKKRPDHFYFTRLYDPYIKKEFDILQATAVRNIPDNVRELLCARYEYIAAEKEIIPTLTGDIRVCDACGEWCPHTESVQCDRCKHFYHMSCVSPPLLAKPTKGYGWKCGSCGQPDDRSAGGSDTRSGTPATSNMANTNTNMNMNGTKTRGAAQPKTPVQSVRPRGRPRKDRVQAELEQNMEIKTFKGWPFRYFGIHTFAEDTLDEDDFIVPRTVTRLGPKYQAVVPARMAAGPITHRENDRGGDNTIDILGSVDKMSEKDVAELQATIKKLATSPAQASNVDWLTEAVQRLSKAYASKQAFSTVSMKQISRMEKWKTFETRYSDKDWSEEEKAAFESAIQENGAELRIVREEVGTGKRSQAEVVRFYGHWKNGKLRKENELKRRGKFVTVPSRASSELSDDGDGNVNGNGPVLSGNMSGGREKEKACASCRTKDSRTWFKAPKHRELPSSVLCDSCSPSWRKYAELPLRSVRDEASAKKTDKREGTPLASTVTKKTKTAVGTTTAPVSRFNSPPQIITGPQLQCIACNKKGSVGQVIRCTKCTMQVHAGSCGAVVPPTEVDSWVCDLCNNEKTEEASLTTDCVLCPRRNRDKSRAGMFFPPPDTFLRSCKPTEGQGWAHIMCAVFMPETRFTDVARLRLVEGIASIPPARWARECYLCKDVGGAVLECQDCTREFHVSCAWKVGARMGFELVQPKGRQRDASTLVEFRGETGVLTPVIRCKEHERTQRRVYTVCDMDGHGQTCLQLYTKHYKRAQGPDLSYGLLRKARRLDDVLKASNSTPSSSDKTLSEDQQCTQCRTTFSPMFYPQPSGACLCHKCHFEETKPEMNGTTHTPMAISVA